MGSQRKANRSTPNGAAKAKQTGGPSALEHLRALKWLPRISWYDDLVALTFDSDEDNNAAIDLCWTDKDLRGVPHEHAGERTLIVPAVSLPFFRKKARNFVVEKVLWPADLSVEEWARMRRDEMRS